MRACHIFDAIYKGLYYSVAYTVGAVCAGVGLVMALPAAGLGALCGLYLGGSGNSIKTTAMVFAWHTFIAWQLPMFLTLTVLGAPVWAVERAGLGIAYAADGNTRDGRDNAMEAWVHRGHPMWGSDKQLWEQAWLSPEIA